MSTAHAAPVLINGGFETGDFSGWVLTGSSDSNVVAPDQPNNGDYSAFFGQVDAPASIAQTVATQAGHDYIVSFWLSNLGGSVDNTSTATTFQALAGDTSLFTSDDKTATDYTRFDLQFTAASDTTALAFLFRNDETFWLFDDVSISELMTTPTTPAAPASVPEPSSALILALGLALLSLQRRRR